MKHGLTAGFWHRTPFQLSTLALIERGVTTRDLAGDKRRPDGGVADLLWIASAARG